MIDIFLTSPPVHLVSSHMRQCCYNGCQFPKGVRATQRRSWLCGREEVLTRRRAPQRRWCASWARVTLRELPGWSPTRERAFPAAERTRSPARRRSHWPRCSLVRSLWPPSPLRSRSLTAALLADIFARQLKRPVRPLPDLVARTEQALASHCGVLVRQALMAHLAREREPLAEPLKKSHVWRVQAWEPERAGVVPAAAVSASLAEAGAEEARPQRKQMLLFALSESELGRAQGGADAGGGGTTNADQQTPSWATIPSFSVAFPLSLALSAAQWRLEAFRAGCRPPGIRPSGEEERRKESVAASPSIEIQ